MTSKLHIGYKKLSGDNIAELLILGKNTEGREGIVNRDTAQMNCESAEVLSIYNMFTNEPVNSATSLYDKLEYTVGHVMTAKNYNENCNLICSYGIQYFLTKNPALMWELNTHSYTGEQFRWRDNGKLESITHWVNGQRHGKEVWFDPDGKLQWEFNWENGQEKTGLENFTGTYQERDENGQLHWKTSYVNGQKHGLQEQFYSNGQLKSRMMWVNGILTGLVEGWHENGQLSQKMTVVDGIWTDLAEEWYPNGQLKKRRTRNNNGNTYEEEECWYADGQVKKRLNKIKEYCFVETFYPNGQLESSKRYKCSNMTSDGLLLEWYPDGKLRFSWNWVDGTSR